MAQQTVTNLTEMRAGEAGVIIEFTGGHKMASRLQSMGMRPGKKIIKVSSHFWQGPQTVEIENIQLAIGFGMAKKIFVKVER
ncbi:MAG: ferrous iron transport protein A [Candidatus Aureabacteria bacterium]|nr:ferrous iron transport protein A [Candidatus Auribacterota bacterium]